MHSEGDLTPESTKYLTVELALRLATERHPTKNLLSPSTGLLPILPSYFNQASQQNGAEPIYIQVSVPRKSFLPNIKPTSARSPAPPPTSQVRMIL